MYRLLRILIFVLSHEQAHRFVVFLLRLIAALPGGLWLLRRCCAVEHPSLECEVFGVKFRNRIGAAAGLDRNGEIFTALGALGLGFVEIGTLTPNAQSGNPTPRAFSLADRRAILHRTGQPNRGLQSALHHLRRNHRGVVVGCNLGCNASTPPDDAPQDILRLFRNLYQYADYFTINVSGDDIRDEHLTQSELYINRLLEPLFDFRRGQNQYRPILLKISPDLTNEEIDTITDILIRTPLDGIVATNGTQQLPDDLPKRIGKGRLSGRPLTQRSIEIVRRIHERSGGGYPIIGSGGMMTPEDVEAMLAAGADLVQLCTGLIFEGPRLVKQICTSMLPVEEAATAPDEEAATADSPTEA